MSVALLVVVQLALLIPIPIASPLARAPCSSVSVVIVMRSHCSSAQPLARFMSLAATAQGCVSLTLSSSEWALKLWSAIL
jgi:small neutral amino acid transporter SnatA (MarC family)